MAAVHCTTIPCEPNTAYKAQRNSNFYSICPCTKDIEQPGFEDFITFLYVFINVFKVVVLSTVGKSTSCHHFSFGGLNLYSAEMLFFNFNIKMSWSFHFMELFMTIKMVQLNKYVI